MHLLSFSGIRETLLCIFNGCTLAVSHFSSSVALGRGCQRKTSQKVRLLKGLTSLGLQFFQSLLLAWPRDQWKKLWKVPWLPWTLKSKKKTIWSLHFSAKLLSLEKTKIFWILVQLRAFYVHSLVIPNRFGRTVTALNVLLISLEDLGFSLALQLQL